MVLANANKRVAVVAELQLTVCWEVLILYYVFDYQFLPSNYETHIALFQTNTTNEPAGGWFWQDTITMTDIAPMRVNDATGVLLFNHWLLFLFKMWFDIQVHYFGEQISRTMPGVRVMTVRQCSRKQIWSMLNRLMSEVLCASLVCRNCKVLTTNYIIPAVQPLRREDYSVAQNRSGMTTTSTLQTTSGITNNDCAGTQIT